MNLAQVVGALMLHGDAYLEVLHQRPGRAAPAVTAPAVPPVNVRLLDDRRYPDGMQGARQKDIFALIEDAGVPLGSGLLCKRLRISSANATTTMALMVAQGFLVRTGTRGKFLWDVPKRARA